MTGDEVGGPSIGVGTMGSPIQEYLTELHARFATVDDGEVATYIPELAKADPSWFGICLATADGTVYEVGDTRQPFTIQSISKPFTYGLALEDRGRDVVTAKIGVEPTGDAFNSISLAPGTGVPLNPMINAGAIAAASLVAGHSPADKLARLTSVYSLYAGRKLDVDLAVFESEHSTGHRNRAIGHMLRNFDIVTEDPEPALDLYFRQCSVSVDCRDLAWMGATLANNGVNPCTGERAVREEYVQNLLTVMATCGMYDYAGEWLYNVGLPAKSGVSGGILAVLPGQLALAVFSPRLDAHGNSVRGIAVCRQISKDWNLHFLRTARAARSAIRASYTLASIGSRRRRTADERVVLDHQGKGSHVYELQGDLGFAALEAVVRAIVSEGDELRYAIVDFKRVTQIAACGVELFVRLVATLGRHHRTLVLANSDAQPRFLRTIEEELAATDDWGRLLRFADLDAAIEWCENRILSESLASPATLALPLAEHPILQGMSPEELVQIAAIAECRRYEAGKIILHRGEPGDYLCLLLSGRVSVTADLPNGRIARLASLSTGMVFGELAILDHSPRTADVRADTAVECAVLLVHDLDMLGVQQPSLKVHLLENLLRNASRTVGRLNSEIQALSR